MIEGQGPELEALVPEWRRLAELRGNPFVTPEWFLATVTGEAKVVCARRPDGTLLGLLPLVEDSWRGVRALRFGGRRLGDRLHPVAAAEDEPVAAAKCLAALAERGETRIVLDKCADESGWLDRARGRGRSAWAYRRISTADLPRIGLAGRDWDAYLGGLSKNLRSRVGRMERKLIREHGMTIRDTREGGELEADFETLFELHDARRDELDGTSLGSRRHRMQLLDFCRSALANGWLRLRIMECDERAVAAFLGWRVGDTYCFYQSGFDPDWGRLSVGLVNLALAVRDAFEEGAAEFDLLLGDEEYKLRLADGKRTVATGVLAKRYDLALGLAHAEAGLRAARHEVNRRRARRQESRGRVGA